MASNYLADVVDDDDDIDVSEKAPASPDLGKKKKDYIDEAFDKMVKDGTIKKFYVNTPVQSSDGPRKLFRNGKAPFYDKDNLPKGWIGGPLS